MYIYIYIYICVCVCTYKIKPPCWWLGRCCLSWRLSVHESTLGTVGVMSSKGKCTHPRAPCLHLPGSGGLESAQQQHQLYYAYTNTRYLDRPSRGSQPRSLDTIYPKPRGCAGLYGPRPSLIYTNPKHYNSMYIPTILYDVYSGQGSPVFPLSGSRWLTHAY